MTSIEHNRRSRKKLVIVGAGGFGREVLQIYRSLSDSSEVRRSYEFCGFLDDDPAASAHLVKHGVHLGVPEAIPRDAAFVVAISHSITRQDLVLRTLKLGAQPLTLIHPMTWIGEQVVIGDGTIICATSSITTNIVIGSHVHVNLGCTIGHDCVIEDFVTLSPGVHLSGAVTIKRCAGLGTGAVVLPGITVGEGAMVGAGAVVTKDVADHTTVVGIPARPIGRNA